jgi:hypothetical protein
MKRWYLSKTLWVNLIAILAISLQGYYGKEVISTDLQAMILGVINIILRSITNKKLTK